MILLTSAVINFANIILLFDLKSSFNVQRHSPVVLVEDYRISRKIDDPYYPFDRPSVYLFYFTRILAQMSRNFSLALELLLNPY